ncbi:phage tail assembly protein [Sphingomonas sp. TX0522]|jgi:hypothetical protein|uniref:phage tail assembly protein n=1 Tax=Sphingomonas sp. TX0522 TaxID=2479205 RepID=UPI0018E011E4|nr:phage tail assembly protein [Sphingomonas sp. TX0522]
MNDTDTPAMADIMPDTRTLTLRKPVPFLDESVATLDLREPRAGEMLRWAHLSGIEANIVAVSVVSGRPVSVIGQLVARDIIAAAEFINAFGLVSVDRPQDVPAELVIDLRYPIEHGETTYRQIALHEPTANQLIEWDKADGILADLKIIGAVSGVPEVALHKLGARDLVAAGSYLANFLVPGLPAGDR